MEMESLETTETPISRVSHHSIVDDLRFLAAAQPNSIALSDPVSNLTYAEVANAVVSAGLFFQEAGLLGNRRVACLLPNNASAALTYLSTMAWCECVPISPGVTNLELNQLLSDLSVDAIVLPETAPIGLKIPSDVQSFVPEDLYRLYQPENRNNVSADTLISSITSSKQRTCLVVRTSGTTSGPKVIPLSEYRLKLASNNMIAIFKLSESDNCLCPMPLYHTHGLITGMLCSVLSGGKFTCLDGYPADHFFETLGQIKPTWITAVPAMYQAALAESERSSRPSKIDHLRFIRSSSAPLAASLIPKIETLFDAPLIETYGITEASVVASNPLPPHKRKAGSVGCPSITEVSLRDEHQQSATEGEILAQGANCDHRV